MPNIFQKFLVGYIEYSIVVYKPRAISKVEKNTKAESAVYYRVLRPREL